MPPLFPRLRVTNKISRENEYSREGTRSGTRLLELALWPSRSGLLRARPTRGGE
mgnify:CR=1 FL=1